MSYFTDSACTEPAGVTYKYSCPTTLPAPRYGIIYSSQSDSCDSVSHAAKLVKLKRTGLNYYGLNQGQCVAQDTTNIDTVYAADGDYPLANLPLVDEVVPPLKTKP
jgi:hypothetical protein